MDGGLGMASALLALGLTKRNERAEAQSPWLIGVGVGVGVDRGREGGNKSHLHWLAITTRSGRLGLLAHAQPDACRSELTPNGYIVGWGMEGGP